MHHGTFLIQNLADLAMNSLSKDTFLEFIQPITCESKGTKFLSDFIQTVSCIAALATGWVETKARLGNCIMPLKIAFTGVSNAICKGLEV